MSEGTVSSESIITVINPRAGDLDASPLFCYDHVRGVGRRNAISARIVKGGQVETREEILAIAEKDRHHGEMQFVDQAGAQILADGRDAAPDPDILSVGDVARLPQCGFDAVRHEVEGCSAFHGDRSARMVGEHEDRHVVGRIGAPPAFPALIRPWTSDRSEHVSAHDPCADIREAPRSELVVDTGLTALLSEHLLEGPRPEDPLVQVHPVHAKRVLPALIGSGAITVEGQRECGDA
jgi:hypothetical protein